MESLSSSLLMMMLVVERERERDSEMVITEAVSPVTTNNNNSRRPPQQTSKQIRFDRANEIHHSCDANWMGTQTKWAHWTQRQRRRLIQCKLLFNYHHHHHQLNSSFVSLFFPGTNSLCKSPIPISDISLCPAPCLPACLLICLLVQVNTQVK